MQVFSSSSFQLLKGHLWIKTLWTLKWSQVSAWWHFLKKIWRQILVFLNLFWWCSFLLYSAVVNSMSLMKTTFIPISVHGDSLYLISERLIYLSVYCKIFHVIVIINLIIIINYYKFHVGLKNDMLQLWYFKWINRLHWR